LGNTLHPLWYRWRHLHTVSGAHLVVVALIALGVNDAGFVVARHERIGLILSSLIGIVCGTLVTYRLNNRFTFR
jgi:putative flippase GtrA